MSCRGILKYVSKAFIGFSVGCYINREVICYQLDSETNLPTFRLNAPVVNRTKVNRQPSLYCV